MFTFVKTLLEKLIARFFKKNQIVDFPLDGCIPDAPDARDRIFEAPDVVTLVTARATKVDLTPMFGPVENQGRPNSCVGHAVTSVLEAVLKTSDKSRLFVYYGAREVERRTTTDSGCAIRSALSGVSKKGAASETLWPYDTTKVTVKPSSAAYADGLKVPPLIQAYERVTTLAALKAALAAGLPVAFGFKVHTRFRTETVTTGICTYPVAGDTQIGSHAVVAVGFDDATQMVKCRNSFGTSWGEAGYFYMPYTWFANMTTLVSDAWLIRPKM